MMLRLLFWVALGILVVFAIRSKLRGMAAPPQAGQAPGPAPGANGREGEAMACCAHCHVYFPASESVRADGRDYCSPAHVRLPAK
jgi:uncharacterized protein